MEEEVTGSLSGRKKLYWSFVK